MLNLRDGFDFLFFSDGSTLLDSELDSLILYLASSRTLWFICCSVCVAFCVFIVVPFLFLFFLFSVPCVRLNNRYIYKSLDLSACSMAHMTPRYRPSAL